MPKITDLVLMEAQDKAEAKLVYPDCPLKKEVDTTSNHYDFLYYFVELFEPKVIVELGTHLGVATYYMHKAFPKAKIYTVDNNLINSPDIGKYAKNLPNVEFILGDAKEVASRLPNDINFIFADEEKDVTTLEANLNIYFPKLHPEGYMIFDDVLGKDFYPDAYRWWQQLIRYNTMDLRVHKGYEMGAIIK